MTEYDLLGKMQAKASETPFEPHVFAKSTVKQLLLLSVKLMIIRDASKSPEKHEKLMGASNAIQSIARLLQSGDLDNAISRSDRASLLFSDVELAQVSVACVVSESIDAGRAFWLVGSGGNHGVDLTDVLKNPKS